MTTEIIESIVIKSYYKGLNDCLMIIKRGVDKGLSWEDSFDSAKKAILKSTGEKQ